MDRIVGLTVRLMVFLGRFARFIPGIGLSRWQPGEKLRILLAGYNGARNTGADVRVAEIVRQIEAVFGTEMVSISVMTLDAESIRPYFAEYDNVDLVEFSAIFPLDAFRLCSSHHIALLCEGSTLKSKFANALTLFYCEVAGVMKAQGKPCIAYGSEAGDMDPFLARMAKTMFSDVRFIARTRNSLDVVRELGLEGRLGTDTAWPFDSSSARGEALQFLGNSGWDGEKPLLGIAAINPFWWPVRPSLVKTLACMITGDHSFHFQKWYHFSWSQEREAQFDAYLQALAHTANAFAEQQGFQPVIIGMERLDEDACTKLEALLNHPAPVVLSKRFDGYVMTEVLRSLTLLITSRYHAEVLSMAGGVPTVAVSMDERLTNLSQELGFESSLLCSTDDENLAAELPRAAGFALANKESIQTRIAEHAAHCQVVMDGMGRYMAQVVDEAFPGFISDSQKAQLDAEEILISQATQPLHDTACSPADLAHVQFVNPNSIPGGGTRDDDADGAGTAKKEELSYVG